MRTVLEEAQSSFRDFIVDDLVGSVAHALDTATLNGVGSGGVPLGICQFPGWPTVTFISGTATYKGLTAMKLIAGQNNADAAPDSRMGWATSNAGREALEQTDQGGTTTTGRFAWKSHACRNPAAGELESIESVLGQPAAATESIPSGFSGHGLSNATVLLYGNWRHIALQLFGPMDVIVNPYLLASNGLVRFNVFQGADVLFLYPGQSFVTGTIVAPNP
jgi:HK97 family phage major capsid protein